MFYLDVCTLNWAKENGNDYTSETIIDKDSNGNILKNGDAVSLIKNLEVKGAKLYCKTRNCSSENFLSCR